MASTFFRDLTLRLCLTRGVLLAAALLVALVAPVAHAEQLWASSLAFTISRVDLSQLTPTTGAASPSFGVTGGAGGGATDLAGDPLWQGVTLWGVRNAFNTSYLAAWNPVTRSFVSESPINTPALTRTLAIDPTDGRFYGTASTNLFAIDPANGNATLVGSTSGMSVEGALGFDADGNLYGVSSENRLVAIDKTSGATTLIATLPISGLSDIAVRPTDGVLLGSGGGPDYRMYQINLSTGALTNLGPSMSRPSGLAFTGLRADFDSSGKVDAADLASLTSNFGVPAGAAYAQGDANGDGAIDGDDLLVWQRQLGMSVNPPASNHVPEPGATLLGACALVALTPLRHRKT